METLVLILHHSKDTTDRVVRGTNDGGGHANQLGGLIGQVPHLWAA